MEKADLAIKYKSKVYEALLVINNIKNVGFRNDAEMLTEKLNKIRDGIKHEIKANPIEGYEVMSYEQDYSKGINNLNKFINKMENDYDVYVKVFNSCKSIDMKLQKNDISTEEFENCISEIIYDMKIMVESGTLDYDDEAHIVSKLYDTVYSIIKLEILRTGKSQVYSYAINRNANINIAYLNSLVARDLSDIDLSDKKNARLLERLYELGKNGVSSNYFDLEVMKLILMGSDNIDFKKVIIANVTDVQKKVIESYKQIERDRSLLDSAYNNIHSSKNRLKIARQNVMNRIGSFILALSLMGAGAVGINAVAKKLANVHSYIKTTTTYSSLTDETLENTEQVYNNKENEVYIRVYEPWRDRDLGSGKVRQYLEYDVSNIDAGLDKPKDYYEYGVDNFQVRGKLKYDKDDSNITLYDDKYVEVETITYEDNGVHFEEDQYLGNCGMFYTYYTMLLVIATVTNGEKILNETKQILNKLKCANEDYDECVKKLNDIDQELLDEINKNEELRNKFNELYEANKYLLDNPEELYNRVNNLTALASVNDAKKLVKDNKKGR